MKSVRFISNVLVLCLAGSLVASAAQGKGKGKGKNDGDNKSAKHEQKEDKKEAKHENKHENKSEAEHEARQEARHEGRNDDRRDDRNDARQNQRASAKPSAQSRPAGWDKGKKVGWGNGRVPPGKQARHSRERQMQLISEQRQRVIAYRTHLEQQQIAARQYSAQLQQDRRTAAYRYQQAYLQRLRQQQAALRNNYNYNNDPYFYTANSYSYNRDGSVYQTNQYGANQLRAAVNSGYAEGFRAGQADQQDRFTSGYQNSYAYQDANYGYNGYANDQDTYNYYFRQGFTKGYDDGYNRRTQFGTVSSGKYSILGNVLKTILNLQNLQQ